MLQYPLYRRLKGVIVLIAALFLLSLYLATATDVWATAMPVIAFGLLFLLVFVIAMALLASEQVDAGHVDEDFMHHDTVDEVEKTADDAPSADDATDRT